MVRKAILHIGTMKTGSTSIQTFMVKHRESMIEQGAYYPTSPGPKAHSLLTVSAAPTHRVHQTVDSSIWKGMEPAARIAQFHQEFDDEMTSLPDAVDRVIFSDERLSFMLGPADIRGLAERMRQHFAEIVVVVYLRRQDYYLASRYAEQLRTGQIRQPDHVHRDGQNLREYDFHAMMERWSAGFGETAMMPRVYENTPSARFDSVADFAGVCRLDLPPINKSTGASRPSMNLAGQQILLSIGAQLQQQQDARQVRGAAWSRLTQTVTAALPGKGWLPTRDEAAAFVSRFAEGNEDIRRRWHPDRPTLFSMDFSDLPEHGAVLTDADKYAAACDVIIEAMNETVKQSVKTDRTIAAAAIASGNNQQARRLLRRRLRKDGGDIPARIQLANICLEEGKFNEVHGLIDAIMKLSPEAKGLKRLKARLTAAEGPAKAQIATVTDSAPADESRTTLSAEARAERRAKRMAERRLHRDEDAR